VQQQLHPLEPKTLTNGRRPAAAADCRCLMPSAAADSELLRQAEEAKASLQGRLGEATQESEANARTCESLRAKLRELSARGKDRDFLDSYEEVMRDEMMTMKDAFERKLRLAKEEAEASSRRNSELIRNLSTERLGLAKR
jgi:exonuclease VII large subunit